jgi:hypothetical protein
VSIAPNDDFVVVWESEDSTQPRDATLDTLATSIQARLFDAAGTPIAVPVDAPGCTPGCDPTVPPCSDICDDTDDNDFQVNTFVESSQLCPGVAFDADGGFRVIWDSLGSSGSDQSLYSIQARSYDVDARATGDGEQLNQFTRREQFVAAIAIAYNGASGQFASAWQSRGSAGDDDSGFSIPEPAGAQLAAACLLTLAGLRARRRRAG